MAGKHTLPEAKRFKEEYVVSRQQLDGLSAAERDDFLGRLFALGAIETAAGRLADWAANMQEDGSMQFLFEWYEPPTSTLGEKAGRV